MHQFFSFLFFLFLFNQFSISAQIVSYSEEVGTLEQQQLVDAKNCFFKNQESVSRIWKLNVVDFLNTEVNFLAPLVRIETGLGIGYEQRLKTGWSLNFSLKGNLSRGGLNDKREDLLISYTDINSIGKKIVFSVEPRWYFQKKKQVAQGLSGDNLSGVYVGFQTSLGVEKLNTDLVLSDNHTITGLLEDERAFNGQIKNTAFLQILNIGLQHQFGKNGYFDIKVGAGLRRNYQIFDLYFSDNRSYSTTWETILNYELGLGFTMGNNEKKEAIPNCNVFEYHEDAKRLLKLSIINPTNILSFNGIETTLTAGIEQKIGASPLSLNANLVYYASPSFINRFALEFEPRYYYDLKKRQLAGKTGNNFSANYIGLRSELVFDRRFGIAPVWGLQRQFFKRFLFDFSAGPERVHDFFSTGIDRKGWNFFSELRIGIAF